MRLINTKMDDADIVKSVTDDEFRAYIGPNAEKFMQVRENFKNGRYVSFNLMALLLPFVWLVYRKQWVWALVVGGLFKLAGVAGDRLFGADTPAAYAVYFIPNLVTGFFLTAFYVLLSCQEITILKNKEGDQAKLMALLQKKGGTSPLALSVIVIILVVAVVAVVALPPH